MSPDDQSNNDESFLKYLDYVLGVLSGQEEERSKALEKIAAKDAHPDVSVAAIVAGLRKSVAEKRGIPIPDSAKAPAGRGKAEPRVKTRKAKTPRLRLRPRREDQEKKRQAQDGIATFRIEPACNGDGTAFIDGTPLPLPCRMIDLISLLAEYRPDRPEPPGEKSRLIPWKPAEILAKKMQLLRERRARRQGREDKGKIYTAKDIWKQINCLRKHMDEVAINRYYVQTGAGRARLALQRPGPIDPVESPPANPTGGSPGCGTP